MSCSCGPTVYNSTTGTWGCEPPGPVDPGLVRKRGEFAAYINSLECSGCLGEQMNYGGKKVNGFGMGAMAPQAGSPWGPLVTRPTPTVPVRGHWQLVSPRLVPAGVKTALARSKNRQAQIGGVLWAIRLNKGIWSYYRWTTSSVGIADGASGNLGAVPGSSLYNCVGPSVVTPGVTQSQPCIPSRVRDVLPGYADPFQAGGIYGRGGGGGGHGGGGHGGGGGGHPHGGGGRPHGAPVRTHFSNGGWWGYWPDYGWYATAAPGCGVNAHWDSAAGQCVCNAGYALAPNGVCIPTALQDRFGLGDINDPALDAAAVAIVGMTNVCTMDGTVAAFQTQWNASVGNPALTVDDKYGPLTASAAQQVNPNAPSGCPQFSGGGGAAVLDLSTAAAAALNALQSDTNYCADVGIVGSAVNTAVHNFKAAWNAANPANPVPIGTGKYEVSVAAALTQVLGSPAPAGCGAPLPPPPPAACPAGQGPDTVTGKCAPLCPNGLPPASGQCAGGGITPPSKTPTGAGGAGALIAGVLLVGVGGVAATAFAMKRKRHAYA